MTVARYDRDHDVMHLFIPPMEPAYDEEVKPGIFVAKSEPGERVVEVIVLDFSRRKPGELRDVLPPEVDVDALFAQANREQQSFGRKVFC